MFQAMETTISIKITTLLADFGISSTAPTQREDEPRDIGVCINDHSQFLKM
jgi:hypothetical protein